MVNASNVARMNAKKANRATRYTLSEKSIRNTSLVKDLERLIGQKRRCWEFKVAVHLVAFPFLTNRQVQSRAITSGQVVTLHVVPTIVVPKGQPNSGFIQTIIIHLARLS